MSRAYSLKKLLAFSLLFCVLGVASAASVSILVNQAAESSDQNPPLPATLLLINVTLDKTVYHPGDLMNVTLRNDFDQTVTFSDARYGVAIEEWNGTSWKFYSYPPLFVIQVVTYMPPGKVVPMSFELDFGAEKPLLAGKYRVISEGGYTQGNNYHLIWGYAEFSVE